jgi:hypothetical protein
MRIGQISAVRIQGNAQSRSVVEKGMRQRLLAAVACRSGIGPDNLRRSGAAIRVSVRRLRGPAGPVCGPSCSLHRG